MISVSQYSNLTMAATRSPLTLSRASAPSVSLAAGKASMATLATFQIPKVDNEPNVSVWTNL